MVSSHLLTKNLSRFSSSRKEDLDLRHTELETVTKSGVKVSRLPLWKVQADLTRKSVGDRTILLAIKTVSQQFPASINNQISRWDSKKLECTQLKSTQLTRRIATERSKWSNIYPIHTNLTNTNNRWCKILTTVIKYTNTISQQTMKNCLEPPQIWWQINSRGKNIWIAWLVACNNYKGMVGNSIERRDKCETNLNNFGTPRLMLRIRIQQIRRRVTNKIQGKEIVGNIRCFQRWRWVTVACKRRSRRLFRIWNNECYKHPQTPKRRKNCQIWK